MGARGNSGVILSQLWRGFARAVQDHETLDAETLVKAFAESRDTAYKRVVRPVEGTILTVSKGIAAGTEASLGSAKDAIDILQIAVKSADESVKQTPELLPVLKQAGVVDSGGKGLFFILEGMLRHVYGESLDTPLISVHALSAMNFENAMQEVEEGQDYEVVVDFFPSGDFELQAFYGKLETMGTSIQVGEGEGMYRMHIHVPLEKRYEPIDYIMGIGTVRKVAIENLMAQMDDIQKSKTGFMDLLMKVKSATANARTLPEDSAAPSIEGDQAAPPRHPDAPPLLLTLAATLAVANPLDEAAKEMTAAKAAWALEREALEIRLRAASTEHEVLLTQLERLEADAHAAKQAAEVERAELLGRVERAEAEAQVTKETATASYAGLLSLLEQSEAKARTLIAQLEMLLESKQGALVGDTTAPTEATSIIDRVAEVDDHINADEITVVLPTLSNLGQVLDPPGSCGWPPQSLRPSVGGLPTGETCDSFAGEGREVVLDPARDDDIVPLTTAQGREARGTLGPRGPPISSGCAQPPDL